MIMLNGETVEAYNIVFGGGSGLDRAIAKDVFKGIPFTQVPALLEKTLSAYLKKRDGAESFASFTRRHDVKTLQEMFSE